MLHQIPQQARRHGKLRERQSRACNPVHGGADALDFAGARRHPGIDRLRAGRAIADHLGGEAPLGLAD